MHSGTRYILTIGFWIGIISILYFFFLIAAAPLWLTTIAIIMCVYASGRWINRQRNFAQDKENTSLVAMMVLITGIGLLDNKSQYLVSKYGVWDAWAMWNLHAIYLSDPIHWKNLFLNKIGAHPDYPLALPAFLGYFLRCINDAHNLLVPYAFHVLITVSIPLVIYLETFRKSLFIAGLALILFATNEFYLTQGLWQLADTLLAFFLLCALVCIQHHLNDVRLLILAAFFLGMCMWTKNEGVIIAIVFLAFHVREFFFASRVKYTLSGLAMPLCCWLAFKIFFAPPNDMVSSQGEQTAALIMDGSRYRLIYQYFIDNVKASFRDVKWGLLIYLALCAIGRKMPDKRLVMLLVILFSYFAIYIVTPHDLTWHLFTSQSRLMHQLMPAAMYVLAIKFSGTGRSGFQTRYAAARERLQ